MSMFEELKQKGHKLAVRSSILGLIGIIAFVAIYIFYVSGFEPEAAERWKWIMIIMCTLSVIGPALNLRRATSVSLMENIKRFCDESVNPDATMARIEKTWGEGVDFQSGRIDNEYIICLFGMRSKVIPLENAVCAYKYISRSNGAMLVHLRVYFSNSKMESCLLNEGAVDTILSYIKKNCPDIATGYTKEMEKLYDNKDMSGLKELAHTQRKGQQV